MAIAFVQDSAIAFSGGSPLSAAISISPTAGNALIVVVIGASGTRTYTASDNINGSTGWNTAIAFAGASNRRDVIFYKANVPSGVTTVTVTHSQTTVAFRCAASEFSGLGTAITVDASDSLSEGSSSNNHTASSGGVTSANPVVAVVVGQLTATATECAAGSGYTEIAAMAYNQGTWERQIFPSGCTAETGAWSNTGTARVGESCIALLSGNATGFTEAVFIFGD